MEAEQSSSQAPRDFSRTSMVMYIMTFLVAVLIVCNITVTRTWGDVYADPKKFWAVVRLSFGAFMMFALAMRIATYTWGEAVGFGLGAMLVFGGLLFFQL